MNAFKLADNVYSVGVINPTVRVFDIIMRAEYGTTYNAYLITGKKNILIDTVHEIFFEDYIDNIESIISVDQIDYVIMNHTEPDHSGSLKRLLEMNPNITVIASMGGSRFLPNLLNREYKSIVAKDGDTLDTGIGELKFVIAPNLHWPDSMFTYFADKKMIFTCDFLGTHYAENMIWDKKIRFKDKYEEAFRHYYDCIFAPFKSFVLAGLDKIEALDVEMACTSHGPILTESLSSRMALYRAWSEKNENTGKKRVAIVFASAYGYTQQLANEAYEELKNEYTVELFDAVEADTAMIAHAVQEADAVLIGSCTINRDAVKPIWDVVTSLDAINTPKTPAGVFGSYGWTGEAVPMLCERLKCLKYNVAGEGLKVQFRPRESILKDMRAYARTVVSLMKE